MHTGCQDGRGALEIGASHMNILRVSQEGHVLLKSRQRLVQNCVQGLRPVLAYMLSFGLASQNC